jgi:Putative prokaryotic signal transducing protein
MLTSVRMEPGLVGGHGKALRRPEPDHSGVSLKSEAGVRDDVWSVEANRASARIGGATMKSSELIAVSTFRSTADAQIAKGILDEAGIESMIRSDNAGGMYPAIAGADLLVRAEDLEKATEALHRRHRRSN